jgi:hypothetical protein
MREMTPAGYLFIGTIGGAVIGFICGALRERKGKNKKYIFWGPDIKKEEK